MQKVSFQSQKKPLLSHLGIWGCLSLIAPFQTAHLSGCHTHLGQLLPKLIQFLLQRSLLLLGGSHLVANLTDLGGDAGSYSNTDGFSSSDIGALSSFQKKKIRLFGGVSGLKS